MKSVFRVLAMVGCMAAVCGFCPTSLVASAKHYVVTNDDVVGSNTVTFYQASGTASAPKLTRVKTVKTGGSGLGGGYFGMARQVMVNVGSHVCVFSVDGGSNDVAAIVFKTQKIVGTYKGSSTDTGGVGGMALAVNPNGNYLYAAFSGSSTIATFTINSGCTLTFVSDVAAVGVNSGFPHGMAARQPAPLSDIMVVAYGDGSIESFSISGGAPVSNNDLQLSTGYIDDSVFPDGVDITKDGHYAIFGDASFNYTEVEVSDLSSGKLATTVKYGGADASLGKGLAANNVWLSPDESLLYISDNLSGQVTVAQFDKNTGALQFGCISKALRGYGTKWNFSSAIAIEKTSGSGSVLWVAEDARRSGPSSIGIVEVNSKGGKCTLTESRNSPASDPKSLNLCWLNAFPQRPF
jgi:6-phosphogluconolactonase (cycloisomerase 2 family)